MAKTYESYKDSGIAWIGEIPSEWKVCKLLNLLRKPISDGPHETPVLQDSGIPFISVDSLNDSENIDFSKVRKFISDELYDEYSKKTIIEENDILFTKAATIGKTAIVKKGKFMVWSPLAILKCNKDISYYRFVYHLMNCQLLIDDVILHGSNNTQINVGMRELEKINTPLPSLQDQHTIATFLDSKCSEIDSLISLQEEMISELQAYKQSVITEAVTKGLPSLREPQDKLSSGQVHAKMNYSASREQNDARINSAETQPVMERKFKDSGVEWIGEIPENWEVLRIKWLLEERKERSETGLEEPLSMSQKYGLIPTKEMDSIPNMASSFVGAKITYIGDLVFNKLKAHLGVFSVSKYFGLVSPDYAVYYTTELSDARYLEYLFKTPIYISEFKKRSSGVGAGLTRLYTSDLFAIPAVCPSIEEQKIISTFIDNKITEINSLIAIKEEKIQELKDYKKSIIYEYVTGKKRV